MHSEVTSPLLCLNFLFYFRLDMTPMAFWGPCKRIAAEWTQYYNLQLGFRFRQLKVWLTAKYMRICIRIKIIIRNLPYSAAPNKRRAALIVSNVFPPRKLCSSLIYFHWAYKVKFPILSSIKVTDSWFLFIRSACDKNTKLFANFLKDLVYSNPQTHLSDHFENAK